MVSGKKKVINEEKRQPKKILLIENFLEIWTTESKREKEEILKNVPLHTYSTYSGGPKLRFIHYSSLLFPPPGPPAPPRYQIIYKSKKRKKFVGIFGRLTMPFYLASLDKPSGF